MPRSDVRYTLPSDTPPSVVREDGVEHMVKCIDDDNGNGFAWHTTGSGKTITSFKASTLLKKNDSIHKCVFVVDRKDLDRPSILGHQRVTATGQIRTRGKLSSN